MTDAFAIDRNNSNDSEVTEILNLLHKAENYRQRAEQLRGQAEISVKRAEVYESTYRDIMQQANEKNDARLQRIAGEKSAPARREMTPEPDLPETPVVPETVPTITEVPINE